MIEPENALPEVTLQGLPESLQAACAAGGMDETPAGPGPGDSLRAGGAQRDGPVADGQRQDRRLHPADPRADRCGEEGLPGPGPRSDPRIGPAGRPRGGAPPRRSRGTDGRGLWRREVRPPARRLPRRGADRRGDAGAYSRPPPQGDAQSRRPARSSFSTRPTGCSRWDSIPT